MVCCLCGSKNQTIFAQVESFGYPLKYYQCGRCGLIFQSEEESQAADPQFYASTYREIYQANPEPTQKDLWVQKERARHLIDFVGRRHKQPFQNVLDIGASAGVLLEALRDTFDCTATGVEPGNAYRGFAAAKGLPMFSSLEDLIATNPNRFDLVSLSHVLEHLSDPLGTLRTIRGQLLTENGFLLIEVPNFYAHDSYELAHLTCFTAHTLQETIRQAGYEALALERHGVPRSAALNLYLTALARPLPEKAPIPAVRPERWVAEKREVGLLYRRLAQKLFPRKAWLPLPDQSRS